jgi:hypothetical protein
MANIHGNLLIGGLRLKGVQGTLDLEPDNASRPRWSGQLLVDSRDGDLLETKRSYRLELDDGRAGQVIVARVETVPGERRVKVLYQGISPLCEEAHPETLPT